MTDLLLAKRIVEALLFSSPTPLSRAEIMQRLPENNRNEETLQYILQAIEDQYNSESGIILRKIDGHYALRTAPDLAIWLEKPLEKDKKLSKTSLEILAVIAWHQPITKGDIEDIRGVALSPTSFQTLLDQGLIEATGVKEAPGRPKLWGTTRHFLDVFHLDNITDLLAAEITRA
ncbi:MAG: SMC-Scp complex subunit ScpB [Alphaproteobacteria bacterium]